MSTETTTATPVPATAQAPLRLLLTVHRVHRIRKAGIGPITETIVSLRSPYEDDDCFSLIIANPDLLERFETGQNYVIEFQPVGALPITTPDVAIVGNL